VVDVGVVVGATYRATGAAVEVVVGWGGGGGGVDEVLVGEGTATCFGPWFSATFCTGGACCATAAWVGGSCPGVTQTVVVASTVSTTFLTTVSITTGTSFFSKGKAETRARTEANTPMLMDFISAEIR